jgi:predicted nucleotidyltransferase
MEANIKKMTVCFIFWGILSAGINRATVALKDSSEGLYYRRIRHSSALSILIQNRGQAYDSADLASQLGRPLNEIEAQLEPLARDNQVVKIRRDGELTENKGKGNIYLIPRERIVNETFQQKIQMSLNYPIENSTRGLYVLNPMSVTKFNRDLEHLKKVISESYQKTLEEISPFFIGYVLPEIIQIIGDDLENIVNQTFELVDDIREKKDLAGRLSLAQLKALLEEGIELIQKNKTLRQEYNRPPGRVVKELNGIIVDLREALPSLAKMGRDIFKKELVGFILFGSWARGKPTEYTDLDILTVSPTEISVDFLRQLSIKIETILGKRINYLHTFHTFQLNLNDIGSFKRNFSSYFGEGLDLYIRNFIIIAQDEKTLKDIWEMILFVQPGFARP